MNDNSFEPDDDPQATPEGGSEPSRDEDMPVDPLTGRRGAYEPEAEKPVMAVKSTRPPWWLVAFTLMIPLTVFIIWYTNWFGRPLSPATIVENLGSHNDKDVAHALIQVAIQVQDAADQRQHSMGLLNQNYSAALADIDAHKTGADRDTARKALSDQFQKSRANIDLEFQTFYKDMETTFQPVIDFTHNGEGRAPPLLEAACNALAAMQHSSTFREPAMTELRRLMGNSNKIVRRAAACNLAVLGDRSGRDIILDMLDDDNPEARGNACLALEKGGLRTDADRVKRLADSDPDPKVREFAYRAYSTLTGQVD